VLNELRALAARTPPGQWILCSNFDNLLQGGDLSREELDGISTNHPIFVLYTNGHDACVNSLALKVTNIPDNIGALPGGGHFGRDEKGQLNLMNPLILSATQFCRAALAKEFVNESILGIVGQCGRRLSGLNSSRTISIPCSDRTCTPSASVLWPAGCSA
jgi:predicted amidohydrolase YtcJ